MPGLKKKKKKNKIWIETKLHNFDLHSTKTPLGGEGMKDKKKGGEERVKDDICFTNQMAPFLSLFGRICRYYLVPRTYSSVDKREPSV